MNDFINSYKKKKLLQNSYLNFSSSANQTKQYILMMGIIIIAHAMYYTEQINDLDMFSNKNQLSVNRFL